MVRVDVLINGERVDALALITHNDNAPYAAASWWKDERSDSASAVRYRAIQAAIGNHIIARSTVKQLRKNVRRNATAATPAVRKAAAEAERR